MSLEETSLSFDDFVKLSVDSYYDEIHSIDFSYVSDISNIMVINIDYNINDYYKVIIKERNNNDYLAIARYDIKTGEFRFNFYNESTKYCNNTRYIK